MISALRQLPANYSAHSALDFACKSWARTLLNLARLLIWLFCSALFIWIVVRFRADAGEMRPVFGAAEGIIVLIGVTAYLLGSRLFLFIPHEGIHRVCYWLFTGDRPSVGRPGGQIYIAPPDCYVPKGLFLVIALAPLVVWSLVIAAVIAFVPAPTVYWLVVALALNIAICTGDLIIIGWTLRQPRNALFNDQGLVTTTYMPTL